MRARAGPNSAATARVEAATANPEREPDQHDEGEVGGAEGGRQRAVDERPVDDDVDVIEPVAQDRNRHGEIDAEQASGDELPARGVADDPR
jgi:hypothetical protein